jgi:hypothetical protein
MMIESLRVAVYHHVHVPAHVYVYSSVIVHHTLRALIIVHATVCSLLCCHVLREVHANDTQSHHVMLFVISESSLMSASSLLSLL